MKKTPINTKDAKDARLMFLRQMIVLPIRFARSLIIIPLLPQSTIFLLKVISTWLGYIPRLMLGTNAILGFYYPSAEALGDEDEKRRYVTLCWQFTLFACITGGLAGVSIAFFYISPLYIPFLLIWGLSIAPINYIKSYLQAKGGFNKIALIDVCAAVSNFIFPLAGWFLFEFIGYIGGSLIAFLITFYIGRNELFPRVIKLQKSFTTNAIGRGIHFWLNGFLSDLAKSFEITMFVILVGISKDFGGQYAVGMTLATIVNQLMTSFSNVFQRKVVKEIAKNKSEAYQSLVNYMALDLLLFTIFFFAFIPIVNIIVYFLPAYAELKNILPFLLLGVFFMRYRFYSGVAFKTEKQFWEIHLGHIVQLLIGVGLLYLIYCQENPDYMLAVAKVVGALLGTVLVSGLFFFRNKHFFEVREISLITFLPLLFFVMLWGIFYFDQLLTLLICELLVGTFIVTLILNQFPKTNEMVRELINIRLRKN